jgi:hypothetical protein
MASKRISIPGKWHHILLSGATVALPMLAIATTLIVLLFRYQIQVYGAYPHPDPSVLSPNFLEGNGPSPNRYYINVTLK